MSRGFPVAEYKARLARAQARMTEAGLGALLLTTEPDLRYFTGFLTRFWESPTRPWFLIVPVSGQPVAVIPSIGAALMGQTWITDMRTWSAPDPDDDGVSLLIASLNALAPGPVGLPFGLETHVRMPLVDLDRVRAAVEVTGDHGIMRALRQVKSPAEVEKIRTACAIAGRAFDRVGEIAGAGAPLEDVFRGFQRLCLEEGADWVPYLAGGAGRLGYADVISPATDTPLCVGDVLMLDTGLVRDGYFCDFDRNYAVGPVTGAVEESWDKLLAATRAGLDALRPGARASDVYHAMAEVVGDGDAGRLGHGLGMQLTEGLSFIAKDHTPLEPGMVITLEPGVTLPGGGIMVHEDVFVVTENGADQLSPPAPVRLPEI